MLSPGKEDSNPYKTPGKPSPETGRKLRSSTLPREVELLSISLFCLYLLTEKIYSIGLANG